MLGTHVPLPQYLQILCRILTQLSTPLVKSLAETIYSTWSQCGTVFLLGEGRAASTVRLIGEHWTSNELEQTLSEARSPMRVQLVLLPESGLDKELNRSASTDDSGLVRLEQSAQPGDLLLAFAMSDPCPQLQTTVDWANGAGLTTWALTAHHGGRLRKSAQHCLSVPLKDVGLVESIHLMLMHWVGDDVSARLFERGRYARADAPPATIKANERTPLPLR